MGKSEFITHWLNTTLLSGRLGRVFFLLYIAALHALVFFAVSYMQSQYMTCRSYTHHKQGHAHLHDMVEGTLVDGTAPGVG